MIRNSLWYSAIVAVACLASPSATGQTLSINGVSSGDNGAVVQVPLGGLMVLEITDDASAAGSGYTIGLSFLNNTRTNGWWLEDFSGLGVFAPITLVAGVPTSSIEGTFTYQNGSPVDMKPDRPGSPEVVLELSDDGSRAEATQAYRLPFIEALAGVSLYVQVVVQDSGLQLTNGVEVAVTGFDPQATLQVARGADARQISLGEMSFVSDPGLATFDPNTDLAADYDVFTLDYPPRPFLTSGITGATTQIDAVSFKNVSRDATEDDMAHIAIPAADGGIPARDLYLVRQNGDNLFGWIVVNHGDNPNTAERVFSPAGSFFENPNNPTGNPWETDILISPDYTHALVSLAQLNEDPVAYVMAIDGTTPYDGGTSAMLDVTPDEDLDDVRIDASMFGASHIVLAYGPNWNNNSLKRFWVIPFPGTGATFELPFDDVATDPGTPIDNFPDNSIATNPTREVFAFAAGTSNGVRDMYVLDLTRTPIVARNVSGFVNNSEVSIAGDAYDGRDGHTALSPDGSMVAFAVKEGNTHFDLYLANSDGSNAGAPIEVTPSSLFLSPLEAVIDVYWPDNDTILFWTGTSSTQSTGGRDLFRYTVSEQSYTNLTLSTRTGNLEPVPPFTTNGTIHGRGFLITENEELMVFIRDNGTDSFGGFTEANIVGVSLDSYDVFDLTGSEFSGGVTPSLEGPSSVPEGRNYNFRSSPGDNSFYWLNSSLSTTGSTFTNQALLFDSDFPLAAFPMSRFSQDASNTNITNLTPAEYGPAAGFSREISGSNSNIYFADASQARLEELETGVAISTGSFWVVSGTNSINPAFVYAYGTSPDDTPTAGTEIRYVEISQGGTWTSERVGTVGGAEYLGVLSATRD